MAEPPTAKNLEDAAIGSLLDELHAAAARADGPAYFELFTPDAVFIGTDVRERWSLAQFRVRSDPIFADGRGWTYIKRSRHIEVGPFNCGVAWFDDRPKIPLHTNGSENDIRTVVTKRQISGGTVSENGKVARDTILGLLKTCSKLGVSFYQFLGDRFAAAGAPVVPALPDLLRLAKA